jgi:glutamate dehydrogenase
VAATTARFASGARVLAQALPDVLQGDDRASFEDRLVELGTAGVPPALARRVASMPALLSVFDIVEDGELTGAPQPAVTAVYFGIGSLLGLDWLRDRILELPRNDRWQALARAALRDDLYEMHRALARDVLAGGTPDGAMAAIDAWLAANRAVVERSRGVLADVQSARTYDTTTLPVALRELKNLVPEAG